MSAAQHTPGPWAYQAFDTEKGVVFDISQADADISQVDVAYTYSHEANARLIAAAPELMSSLIDIYAAYCNVMHSEFDFPSRPWTPERDNDLTAINARAAIAKATGGAL